MSSKPIKYLIFIFLLASVFHLYGAIFISQHPSFHWDAAHYTVLARNLAQGNGFVNEPGHPTAYRTPLYPFMVSIVFRIFGERHTLVYLLQALLGAFTCTGIAWMAYRLAGSRAILIVGILCALNPASIEMTGLMLTETTFTFLAMCVLILLSKALAEEGSGGGRRDKYYLWFFSVGLSLGLATLCRPNAIPWAVLIGMYVILFQRKRKVTLRLLSIAVLLVGLALPVLPWIIRNKTVIGAPTLVTTGGRNFWEFRHRDRDTNEEKGIPPDEFIRANELADQRTLAEIGGDPSQMVPVYNIVPRYHAFFHDQQTIDAFRGLSEGEADRLFFQLGLSYTMSHPFRVLKESVIDVLKIFSPGERDGSVNPVLFISLPFLLLGIWVMFRQNPAIGAAVFTGILSLVIVSFLVIYEARYRVPYEPFLFLASGIGIETVLKRGIGRRFGILLACGLVLLTAASFITLSGQVTS